MVWPVMRQRRENNRVLWGLWRERNTRAMYTVSQWQDAGVASDALDDDELLRDALAFIGDFDFELDAATPDEADDGGSLSSMVAQVSVQVPDNLQHNASSSHSPVSASVSSGEDVDSDRSSRVPGHEIAGIRSKPKVINRARTRRREELMYLRGLVGDLEEQLKGLQSCQEEWASTTSTEAYKERLALADAWADVATRQSEQRQKAQSENTRLKRLLQEQIQVGKSLEHLLLKRKRPNLEVSRSEPAGEKRHRYAHSRSLNDELVFDELLEDCASLYSETASMVARFDAIPPAKPQRRVQLIHDPKLGMVVQTTEHRILPFGYEDTVSAVWNSIQGASTVHSTGYHDVDSTEDTMKLRFCMTSEIGRMRGGFAAKMVARRYAEASRTVIAVSSIFDPTEVALTNMEGVRIRYTGWHVIEPMAPSSGQGSRGSTKMAVFYRAVSEVDGDLRDQTRKVGTLTNFLLSTISLEVESRSQSVDNQLFELARRDR